MQATVREQDGEIVFTHRVLPGAAGRSYGLEVARMAGLPDDVVARARAVLAVVEPLSANAQEQLLAGLGKQLLLRRSAHEQRACIDNSRRQTGKAWTSRQ